jgi:DNA topoisomerase IB
MGGEREREGESFTYNEEREPPTLPSVFQKKEKKKKKRRKEEEEEKERERNDSLTFTGRNLMRKLSKFFFHHL